MFGALGSEITGRLGTIDKFIGDAIMAFWNAPVDVPNHPRLAAEAALGMRKRLRALNDADAFGLKRNSVGVDEVVIGVGISTGEALVGNMGLETRFDYSALGDTVNVASRVESACKEMGYDLLVTSATRDAAGDLAFLDAGARSRSKARASASPSTSSSATPSSKRPAPSSCCARPMPRRSRRCRTGVIPTAPSPSAWRSRRRSSRA